ncbi:MAG: sigma D regulator [Gammaproteobacteria bacterium]|nr:sigma D regulator [Gammaproteobacteria bacterium]MDH5594903.1 sigma D regulator [Gammaproteobacteria bacterium]MDH5613478.1 sigma D regulator [Gammaproteobacteria bacterium]
MAAEIKQFVERRTRSRELIQKLVDARTDMLTLYGKLAENHPFDKDDDLKSIGKLLQDFCNSLIDYTAEAHFHLYKHFADNAERRQVVKEVAEQIYSRIAEITQTIVDFNDKYTKDTTSPEELEQDLSKLGEKLADRIELEDQLIDAFSNISSAATA